MDEVTSNVPELDPQGVSINLYDFEREVAGNCSAIKRVKFAVNEWVDERCFASGTVSYDEYFVHAIIIIWTKMKHQELNEENSSDSLNIPFWWRTVASNRFSRV